MNALAHQACSLLLCAPFTRLNLLHVPQRHCIEEHDDAPSLPMKTGQVSGRTRDLDYGPTYILSCDVGGDIRVVGETGTILHLELYM